VLHIQDCPRRQREQLPQEFLPLKQRLVPQVAAIQPDEIERIEALIEWLQ
jgi:hypothetical protein